MTFPTISDDPGNIFARFSVPSQPAVVIVATTGATQTLLGAVDDNTLDTLLAEAVTA